MPHWKHMQPNTPGGEVTRLNVVVLKEQFGYTLCFAKEFQDLVIMDGSVGPQKSGLVFHVIVFDKDYEPSKFHLNNSNSTGWNIELIPEQARILGKHLPSREHAGYGELVLRIIYSDPFRITGKIGNFEHSIVPFDNIVMTKEQKAWTRQLEHAGEVMSLEVQAGLDGFKMVGGIRINRGVRDPVRKALWMPEGIVGNQNIKTFEDAGIERLLMTSKPYICHKEKTIPVIHQDEDKDDEENDIDSIADEFEFIETEDAEE